MKHMKPISKAQTPSITGVMIIGVIGAVLGAVTPFIAILDARKKPAAE